MTTILLVLSAIISTVCTVPLQLQLLQPMLQQQQISLQQLIALQQLQSLQKLNLLQNPRPNFHRPLLILLPKSHNDVDKINEENENKYNINLRKTNLNTRDGIVDEDSDSVIIEAEPAEEPQKAILLIPNEGRFSIGDFISSIPFLPIEINVPDSISWIYNGISGIISGIGQRLPFRPQSQDTTLSSVSSESSSRIKPMHMRKVTPILLMPWNQPLPFLM